MSTPWTSQQILSLSPDAASTKRGQALAKATKWPLLGQSGQAVWGECQGSGKKPYRTSVDLGLISGEPAFRCSCPSRKFPCKHALGLLLLWTQQGGFSADQPPDWVAAWLDKREKAVQKQQGSPQSVPNDGPAVAGQQGIEAEADANSLDQKHLDQKNQEAQQRLEKRIEKRSEKVAEGLVDLNQWLSDIMRSGIADLANRPYRFWDQAAARLVDAQAPGLARRVKALAGIPHSGKGWPERMLKALGRLYLLGQGFSQLAALAPMMQAEIYRQMGFPQNKDDLLRRAEMGDPLVRSISDTWQILGKVVTEEESLKSQRVWLWGIQSQKAALVLSFAYGRRQPLDTSLMPGESFDGKLIFYPGTGIQRALVVSKQPSSLRGRAEIGVRCVEAAIAQYSHALSENPWLAEFPIVFSQIWLHHQSGQWFLQDANQRRLPVSPLFTEGWELLSMSGGRSLGVFGEWDGELFLPLSAWNEEAQHEGDQSEKTFVMLGGAQK